MPLFVLRYSGLGGLRDLDVQTICQGDGIEILQTTDNEISIKAPPQSLVQLTARLSPEWTWSPVQRETMADQPIIDLVRN